MNRNRLLALGAIVALLAFSAPSHAYRLLQRTATGRTDWYSAFNEVSCGNSGGFTHWNVANTNWYHNVAGQGSGKDAALFNAMNVWNFVPSASHTLTYKGRTTAGFIYDGFNVVSWGVNQGGCTNANNCLALTSLFLNPGQLIIEADIVFNNNYTWTTNGSNYDTWSVAAHEFGHTLGIAHTDVNVTTPPHPTMRTPYFDSTARVLETDDKSAIQCVQSTYPPATSCIPDGGVTDGSLSCCSGYTFSSYTNSDGTFAVCASAAPGGCAGSGGIDDTLSTTSCCSGSAVTGSTRCLDPNNTDYSTCVHTCQ